MGKDTASSILVVDDDKNQRSMLAFALRDRGYRVVAVESGLLALERAKEETFDAAICDIMMPGINGVDTLGQLKLAQPGLKIIMATAYATTALAAASMKGGASGYIAKPYDLKELFVLLDAALSGKGP
jgi:DNA-binding NtrC family response regulator